MMAAGLDHKLIGAALNSCLPPIAASRQRTQGLEPEIGGFQSVSRPAGKVWRARSSAFVGQDGMPPEELQEVLWKQFFEDSTQWWDNRRRKATPRHPDFKHKHSKLGLWLKHRHKPAWVDSQLATLDVGLKTTLKSVCTPAHGHAAFAAHEGQSEVGMLWKLLDDGRTAESVDALHLLVQRGCHVSQSSFYRVLKRCIKDKDLVLGRRIHALTIESGYTGDAFLATHLIGLYASHGMLEEAMRVFTKVSAPDAYNWATIIFAYARHGEAAQAAEAIRLYGQLRKSTSVKPDHRIYSAVLKACAAARDLAAGKEVHAHILACPEKPDRFVQVGLVDMYAKCGSLEVARELFDKLSERTVVAWTAMFAGYAQQGMGQEALSLYSNMQQENLAPDCVTYICLLQACASVGMGALDEGKQLHAQIREQGLQEDGPLGVSLINMYSKCGSLNDARRLFDKLRDKNVVAWNAMIAGYAQHGMGPEALSLYGSMQQERVIPPNSVTFVCLLQACASIGVEALAEGKQLHAQIKEGRLQEDVVLGGSLVNMYAKCGSLAEAREVFDKLPGKNVVAWTAMLAGYAQHGMGQEALSLYKSMQQDNLTPPDDVLFICLLQACAGVGVSALDEGKQLHAQIKVRGLQEEVAIGGSLVNMYAKCGSLKAARQLFDILPERNVVTWNAMIAGYVQHELGQEALVLSSRMQQEGFTPDFATYVCLLQACASVGVGALHQGRHLHAQIKERGLEDEVALASSLVTMYAKCGSLEEACRLFDRLPERSIVTWNALIAAYAQQEMGEAALSLYSRMQQEGLTCPNSVTYVCLLQACASVGVGALYEGKQLHAQIKERALQDDLVIGGSLVNMYVKCGSLKDARGVFDKLRERDVVAWTGMIAGYAQQGMGQEALCLYNSMQHDGLSLPNSVTYVCLLQACASVGVGALDDGKQLHRQIKERGLQEDAVLGSSLVNMYAKCGSLEDARTVFDKLPERNVEAWTAMLGGYVQHGLGNEALSLYSIMQQGSLISPDSMTYVCLLQACASVGVGSLDVGKQLHAEIKERRLQNDVVLGASLVNMYAKCGSLQDARSVFDRLPERNVVTWNTIITGYAQQGMGHEALSLYSSMQQEGFIPPDSVTYVCLLQACACVGVECLHEGKQLHAQIKGQGLQADVALGGSLVNMYARCGSLEDARRLFDGLPERNIVTWNAMIAGYAQQGMGEEALGLYSIMRHEGLIPPNSATYASLLQASAVLAALPLGKQLHAEIEERGMQGDVLVGAALVNMYAKSGSMLDSQRMFDSLPERSVEAWGALIGGYARQGESEVVFNLLERMSLEGMQPDGITFLSVLTGCNHSGLVEKGRNYFEAMRTDYGISPTVEHFICMVDLLGRAGHLNEALQMAKAMPLGPNEVVWQSLLAACRKWKNVEIGQQAFNGAVRVDEKNAASYVLMSNIYASANMWDAAKEMEAKRKKLGAWKKPGQSWWTDMSGVVHTFGVGDKTHPGSEGIYSRLEQLCPQIEKGRT